MDTFAFFLILFFLFFSSCKKENIDSPHFISPIHISGDYELYPSYYPIKIHFFPSEQCNIQKKDQIQPCLYKMIDKRLLIYTNQNIPKGIFIFKNHSLFKGIWEEEVRFLRKLQSSQEEEK